MKEPVSDAVLDQLFRSARSINVWTDTPVPDATLKALYDLVKMGPTSANCSPARFLFVKGEGPKARLAECVMAGNKPKVLGAPVTVIIGHDLNFAQELPRLFPHDKTAPDWFSDPVVAETTAFRNASLQAAYLMLAARSLGLDCGPMSGFDHQAVDEAFFSGTRIKTNMLCGLGAGSSEGLFPRSPRLPFEDAAQIL